MKKKMLAFIGFVGSVASIIGLISLFHPASGIAQNNQNTTGDNSPNIVNGSGNVNNQGVQIIQENSREKTVLQNPQYGATMVLNNPTFDISKKNQLGLCESGTEIEIIEEQGEGAMVFVKVKILSGIYKNKIGWVQKVNIAKK